MDRRKFLKGAGIVTVVVAGGVVWRAVDQGVFSGGEGPAYEPWKDWRSGGNEGPLGLVLAAILAASPHNTQPWRFKVSNSAIELQIDTRRNTGALDPFLREEHIGMGCAVENLMLAAAANGYAATVTLLPGALGPIPAEPKTELLAHAELAPGNRQESELYNAIPRRHTNRAPYEAQKAIPADFLEALGRVAGDEADVKVFLFTSEAERKKIVDISSVANRDLYSDPEVERGSDRWIHTRWSEVQKYRDGLTLDAVGLPPIGTAIAKIMPERMLAWVASHSVQHEYSGLMMSAPLIGIIGVRDRYERSQCMRAGRIWQRAHLLATARGLAGRPCNEAVEMIDHERALGRAATRLAMLNAITGEATWRPTFVFYMGYPTWPARMSPRRPVGMVVDAMA